MPLCRCSIYNGKKGRQSCVHPRRSRTVGKTLPIRSVLKCASENRLSLETCWLFVTARFASRKAGLDRIERVGSASIVSAPGAMASGRRVSAISRCRACKRFRSTQPSIPGISAVEVQNGIQIERAPFMRSAQLGDVTGPRSMGYRQRFWRGIRELLRA
jgi:hypothetical protein